MRAITLATAMALSACGGRVVDRPIESSADVMDTHRWCAVLDVGWAGRKHKVVACTDERFCVHAVGQIRKRGALVGITSLSACEWRAKKWK